MKKPHRILQICLSEAWGGLEMVAFETALHARDKGLEVVTVTSPGSPLMNNLKNKGLSALGLNKSGRYVAFGAVRELRRLILANKIESVLVQSLRDLWQVVPALWRLDQVKLVGMSHTFVGIDKKDFLHRWLYGRLDSLVALNSLHRANLEKHLPLRPDQFLIIPNSVDTLRFRPGIGDTEIRKKLNLSAETILIGVVSRLDLQKGLREALLAAQNLLQQKINFHLVIVGDETANEGGTRQVLISDIEKLGLKEHVTLFGFRADIERVIAAVDVLLMPSPGETFGRVIIEAMACQVPVVATRGGGVPDIIKDQENGLLVEPKDPISMAKGLARVCTDKALKEQLGRRGLASVERDYTQSRVEQKLFDNLAEQRNH